MRRITNRSRLMAGPDYWYFIVAFCIGAMDLCGISFLRRYLWSYNGQIKKTHTHISVNEAYTIFIKYMLAML